MFGFLAIYEQLTQPEPHSHNKANCEMEEITEQSLNLQ